MFLCNLHFLKNKSTEYKNIELITILYNFPVKSSLMYGSIMWNSLLKGTINDLEKLKYHFLRYASYKTHYLLPKAN